MLQPKKKDLNKPNFPDIFPESGKLILPGAQVKQENNALEPKKSIVFRIIHLFMGFFIAIINWFKVQEPRWRTILTLILLIAVITSTYLYKSGSTLGATYVFTQTAWNTQTSSNAADPAGRSGWTDYSATTNIVPGANLSLGTTPATLTQTDDGTTNTGFNLMGQSFNQTTVSGAGIPASIKLTSSSGGWTQTESGLNGYASDIAVDSTYAYIVGGNIYGWRIEKRLLTDGSLVGGFGTNGIVVISNPLGGSSGRAETIIIDATYMYVYGNTYLSDGEGGEYESSIIYKMSLVTGAIDTTFHGNGQWTGNNMGDMVLNNGYIYIVEGFSDWVVYKINASDGSSVMAFGINGQYSLSRSGISIEHAEAVAVDATGLYILGYSGGQGDRRLVKINATTGAMIFSIMQSIAGLTLDHLILDNSGLYLGGSDTIAGRLKIEKRSLTDGTLIPAFGSNGVVSNDVTPGSGDYFRSFVIAPDGLITAALAGTNGYLEKRDLTTGALVTTFGSNGFLTTTLKPYSLAQDASSIYPVGCTTCNTSWTMQKASIITGSPSASYNTPGTFTSGPVDLGINAVSWNNLSWTQTGGQTITIKARTADNSGMAGASDFSTCANITNGQSLTTGNCVTAGHRYVQYQATLSTADVSVTPSLDDVTIGYTAYFSNGNMVSSSYDAGDPTNIMGEVSWDENTSLPVGTGITLSIRTADSSANLATALWNDFTNVSSGCAKVSNVVTCGNSAIPAGLKDSVSDGWFQYKVSLTGGSFTPQVDEVRIKYVVNARPEFNSTNGVTASQISDSANPDWGKVNITYSIKDVDTTTGTNTPGFITPSFEYNAGSGWYSIPADKLSADATTNKAVNGTGFTNYSLLWDAKSQIPATYTASAQVRVAINDNEAANNIAQRTSSTFALDSANPEVSTLTINSTTDAFTLAASDNSNFTYRISNNADFSADGSNPSSGEWTDAAGTSISITQNWNFASSPPEIIYVQLRDNLGNTASFSAKAPIAPQNIDIKDISNEEGGEFREFISWAVYSSVAGANFANYKIYSSTDGSSFSLLYTVSDININYYLHPNLDAANTYYYKVMVTDTDGDTSSYSATVNDLPNGQGGTDTTAPTISNVTVVESQATYATITWDSDELSNSQVDFSVSPSTAFGSGQTRASYVTAHSLTVTNLSANTTYLFRVRGTDPLGNTGTNDNSGQGFVLITTSGPVISNVTETSINDNTAEIFWRTNVDSDSYVTYSINADLTSSTKIGSASLVGGAAPFQHQVTLANLTAGTTYYYFVESKDGAANNSKDTNGNNYYSFQTTTDTRAPVISGITTPVIATTAAVIVWQTDELATTQLVWGTTTGATGTSTDLDQTLSIFHVVSLTGLTENTTYYFKVKSRDSAANETTSDEDSFVTDKTTIIQISSGGGQSSIVLDTTPPTISQIKTEDITPFGATIKFTTSEESIGLINYGLEKNKDLDFTAASSDYKKDHSVKVYGLRMGTKYSLKIKAIDKAGNATSSEVQTFTTTYLTEKGVDIKDAYQFQQEVEDAIQSALPSIVPPFVEKPQLRDITEDSATITWRTNIPAYSQVSYADDQTYDAALDNPYSQQNSASQNKVTSHELILTGLKSNTKYHVSAQSYRIAGAVGKSADMTFTTKAGKVQPTLAAATNNSFRIVWNTDTPSTSILSYTNLSTKITNQKTDQVQVKFHDLTIDNLAPGSTYDVKVSSLTADGNIIEGHGSVRVVLSKDVKAPEITAIKIESAFIPGKSDKTQTIVSWKTNEPANSVVYYEEGTGSPTEQKALSNKIELPNNYVTDHSVVLTNLKAGGLYRIQVESVDTAGNKTTFPVRTIVIPRQTESVLDIIFKNFEDTFKFLKK